MSNNNHSPEPWSVDMGAGFPHIESQHGEICEIWSTRPDIEDKANAFRIVACVNYCAGATNQELEHSSYEKAKAKLMDAFSLIGQYRAQRDAMVKASLGIIRNIGSEHTAELRAAVDTVKRHDHSTDPMITALLQILKDSKETPHIQAIAKAALEKGGAL